ncbi:MAG: ADP-ribosylation factor-like protein, partial [Candidatus Kariarchaeaceae archaeon]
WGALVIFDLTNKESLENITNWIKELMDANKNKDIPMLVIGNKSDLIETRSIEDSEVQAKIHQLNADVSIPSKYIEYIETSAKTGDNIIRGFELITKIVYEKLTEDKTTK